jgi:hypothetical protein
MTNVVLDRILKRAANRLREHQRREEKRQQLGKLQVLQVRNGNPHGQE